ncbi:unnamed protein product, partial [Urochloa humidicola]
GSQRRPPRSHHGGGRKHRREPRRHQFPLVAPPRWDLLLREANLLSSASSSHPLGVSVGFPMEAREGVRWRLCVGYSMVGTAAVVLVPVARFLLPGVRPAARRHQGQDPCRRARLPCLLVRGLRLTMPSDWSRDGDGVYVASVDRPATATTAGVSDQCRIEPRHTQNTKAWRLGREVNHCLQSIVAGQRCLRRECVIGLSETH